MKKKIFICIFLSLFQFSKQIYDPNEEFNQKPIRYSSGIKTTNQRPFLIHQNYSKVYHHNPTLATSNSESFTRPFPVYNAHTYGNRPEKLQQIYILNGTRLDTNPTRQILQFNKKKRSPKTQIYKSCPKNATGQFIYESSCNQFLNCWKGRGFVQNCAPGTLFNPQTLECDFLEKVTCISGPREAILSSQRTKKSVTQIGCPRHFSGLIPNYTDCSKFINCVSGIENFMDCPPGTLFDINKNICDFESKAECFNGQNSKLIKTQIDDKLDFQQKSQLQYKFNEVKCPREFQGLHPHPSDCSKFLNCANEQTFIQDCSPGTLFNPKLKICDFPYNVVCGRRKPDKNEQVTNARPFMTHSQHNQNLFGQTIYQQTTTNENSYKPTDSGSTQEYDQQIYNIKPSIQYKPSNNPYQTNYGVIDTQNRPYQQNHNQYQYGTHIQRHETQNQKQHFPETYYEEDQHQYGQESQINLKQSLYNQNQHQYYPQIQKPTQYHIPNPYQAHHQRPPPNQEIHRPQTFTDYNQNSEGTQVLINHNTKTKPIWNYRETNIYSTTPQLLPYYSEIRDPYQTSYTQPNTNNLDLNPTTTNYDQIVNINHLRKTHPFYGTTSKPRVTYQDYDDAYGSSQKFIRSTTPKILQKHWPPPFPSTDTNADYVFEYEDVTLEAEDLSKTNGCKRNEFLCSFGSCIPKNFVCNGIKDCLNGKDEENCIDYISKFTQEKNHKLAVLEKERHDNTSIAACALFCIQTQKFPCKSFNYRKIDKTCFLTDTNIGLTGALIAYYPFDYYELESTKINCTNLYVCNNRKCIDRKSICDGKDDCGDRMDEKNCKPESFGYSVRLTGSKNSNEGQIEVTAFGRTGFICDDQFGLRDAEVVCKELGFELGAAEVKGNSYFAKNVTKEAPFYMMDDVNCLGNETKLMDCDFSGWGIHNCLGQEVVGVVCKTPEKKCKSDFWQCDTGQECIPLAFLCDGLLDCRDESDEALQHCDAPTQIRLANGTSHSEGRIEIRHNGIWGTICDDDFNEDAAKVICRQLGYRGSSTVKKEAYFGHGSGPIWLDQVFCTGNESTIEDCSHWNWGEHNCEHGEDVGVICSNSFNAHYEERHSSIQIPRNQKQYPERCGFRNDNIFTQNSDVHFRVVKGTIAKKGDYPWQAAIKVKTKTSTSHWCGAVIISEKFVLTAAHCLIGYAKGAYVVVAGDYDVDENEGTEQEARIEDFYLHEDFRKDHKMNNDIALVKLKGRGFALTGDVQAICLPDVDTNYETEQNCTISGFGSIESGKSAFSHNLRAGWVPLQKRQICSMPHVYGDALTDGMVCAGSLDEGIDSCDGDSGGPLACLNRGVYTLYGITSWGQHCGYANKPGVYVKVAHYRNWIDNKVKKYSTD